MKTKINKSLMTERVFRNTVKYLLFEAKIHKELDVFFNSKKTKKVMVDIEGVSTQYFLQPNVESFLRGKFSEPGTNLVGMDLAWIRKEIKNQIESGGIEPIEDWINYIEMMRKDEIKRKLNRTDLNEYIDLNDLRSTIDAVSKLSEEQQSVFEDLMNDPRHIQMIAEFDDHEIYFPITVQGSIAFDTPRKTSWCTTKPSGQNLFYSYVARGEDIVLYYILKKSLKDSDELPSKVCLGFINKKLKLPSNSGSESVDLGNNGLNEGKLRGSAYFGDDYDAIVATCQSHIGSLENGHPAREVVKRCCASIEYLKAQIKDYNKDEKSDFVRIVKGSKFYKSPPVFEYCFFYNSDQQGINRDAYLKGRASEYLNYDASNGYFPKFFTGVRPVSLSITNLTQKGIDTLRLDQLDLSRLKNINFYEHGGNNSIKKAHVTINDRHLAPITDLIKRGNTPFNQLHVNITKPEREEESYNFKAPELLGAISEKSSDNHIQNIRQIVAGKVGEFDRSKDKDTIGLSIDSHNFDSHEGLNPLMLAGAHLDYSNAPYHVGMYVIQKSFDNLLERDTRKYLDEIKKTVDSIENLGEFAKGEYGIHVVISNCGIESIPDITLLGDVVNNIEIVNCKNITAVPKFSGVNQSLTILTITNCNLSDSDSLVNIKNAFPNLYHIDISKNPLEELPENCFYNQETETNIAYDPGDGSPSPYREYKYRKIIGSIFRLNISCTKITELPDYIFYNERTGESLIDSNNSEYQSGKSNKPFYGNLGLSFNYTKLKRLTRDMSSAHSKKLIEGGIHFMDSNTFQFSEFEEPASSNKINIDENQIANMGGVENFMRNFKIAKEVKYNKADFNTWGKSNIFTLDGRKNPGEDEYDEAPQTWDHDAGEWVEGKHVPLSEKTIKELENLFVRGGMGDQEANSIIVKFLGNGVERINILNLKNISSQFLSVLMQYLVEYSASHISSIRLGGNKLDAGMSGVIDVINNSSVPIYSVHISEVDDFSAINNIDTTGTRYIDLRNNNLTQFPIKSFENYYEKIINLGPPTSQWNVGKGFDVSNNPISEIPGSFLSTLLKYGYNGEGGRDVPYTNITNTNIKEIDVVKKVLIPMYIAYIKKIIKPEQHFFLSRAGAGENDAFTGYDDDREADQNTDRDDYGYYCKTIINTKDYMIKECVNQDISESNLEGDVYGMRGSESREYRDRVYRNGVYLYESLFDNIVQNNDIYCVFHHRVLLVEIHEVYKKNGYNSTIEDLKKELEGMAGKVGDDILDRDGLEKARKEKEAYVEADNLIDFEDFLESFGKDENRGFEDYRRYENAYEAIHKNGGSGLNMKHMLKIVHHIVNADFALMGLIRKLSSLNVNSLGINKKWAAQQKDMVDGEDSLEPHDIPSETLLIDPHTYENILDLPVISPYPEFNFGDYLNCVVNMITIAKKVMGMMRSSTITGSYAQYIDEIIDRSKQPRVVSGKTGAGIHINHAMSYIMADIHHNIDPDNSTFSFDADNSFRTAVVNVYLKHGFASSGQDVNQPYDPNKYFFYISVPHQDYTALDIDLVKFLSDPAGNKYGIMHSGGKGIQKNPFNNINIDDIEF